MTKASTPTTKKTAQSTLCADKKVSQSPLDVVKPDAIELTIPAQAEWVRVVRLVTVGVANRMGFTYDDIEDLKLAVAEACNNAILHAQPAAEDDRDKTAFTVHVVHIPHPDRLEILVSDAGNPDEVVLPETSARQSLQDTPLAQLPEGGLGLLLIRSLMDEVTQVTDAKTHTLRLVKYLSANR